MPAPRKYTDLTRRAIAELAHRGVGATEITRLLGEGEAGVPAIEIPRRTVAEIAARENGRADLPEGTVLLDIKLGPTEILRRLDAEPETKFAIRWEDGEIRRAGRVARLVLGRMHDEEGDGDVRQTPRPVLG